MVDRTKSRWRLRMRQVRYRVMGTPQGMSYPRGYETQDRDWYGSRYPDQYGSMGTGEQGGEGQGMVQRAKEGVSNLAGSATDTAQQAAHTVEERIEGNPMAAGVIAFGAGLLVAALIPETQTEHQLTQQIEQPLEAIAQQAQEAGSHIAEEMKEPAKEAAQQVKQTATEQAQGAAQHAQETAKGTTQSSR
jgi:ElaB/YqjD/DUF883 family membrane-anchored ribosome-binding protein